MILLSIAAVLVATEAFGQCGNKLVYIRVWNRNETDYPGSQGDSLQGDNGLEFSCFLKDASNSWAHSDTMTHNDVGCDYLIYGSEPIEHDIRINCANFSEFCWAVGDTLVVLARDVQTPWYGEANRYALRLNNEGVQYATVDFTLPVELSSFTATVADTGISLRWETQSETDNQGFRLYRSLEELGEYVCITGQLIQGAGSSASGGVYVYVDAGLAEGRYWYQLEDVSMNGTTRRHGPISAMLGQPTALTPSTWGEVKHGFDP